MKKKLSTQLTVALVALVAGGLFISVEYFLIKWYPRIKQHMSEKALSLRPYSNASLGIQIQVPKAFYGKVESFPDGIRIYRSHFFGTGPSITITSQPNPANTSKFSPQILAKWETDGIYKKIPRYRFEHTKIDNRDAVLIWQLKGSSMFLTARVISPDRIVQADCTPGSEDEKTYLQACETSLRTLQITGAPPPPVKSSPALEEVPSAQSGGKSNSH